MKYLVLIEAPGKQKSFEKYLGPDYEVIATYGHLINLPKKKIGIDLKKDFKPTFVVEEGKEKLLDQIIKSSKGKQMVYLYTDADREGTGIAANIASKLPPGTKYLRASTTSITKKEVEEGIQNAVPLDQNEVDSFEARRILDRLCGYKTSFLVTSATGGKSAGRVQSAALRIFAEREKEILAFVPEEYWEISTELENANKDIITAELSDPDKMTIKDKLSADKIKNDIIKIGKAKVIKALKSKKSTKPQYPFTTSSLQSTAASYLGWPQDKTMRIAQELYQTSFITYHRTDSPNILPAIVANIRSEIQSKFGNKYLPSNANFYAAKASAQGAHEAIRPTNVGVVSCTLGTDQNKLYQLIWKRTVASQMVPSESETTSLEFEVGQYRLKTSGSILLFDGYKKVWDYSDSKDKILPVVKVDEILDINTITCDQKFTTPPPRYSDSSIVKVLEDKGIGRPATYASITKTLLDREYIKRNGFGSKGSFLTTDLGLKVNEFLTGNNFCFSNLDFTKDMEQKLDDVAAGKITKLELLKEFWSTLSKDIENSGKNKKAAEATTFKCTKCNNLMLRKHSKYGEFFVCSDKKCNHIMNSTDGLPVEKIIAPKVAQVSTGIICDKCGGKMLLREGKFGKFLGCENYANTKCKRMMKEDGTIIESKFNKFSKYKKKNKETNG